MSSKLDTKHVWVNTIHLFFQIKGHIKLTVKKNQCLNSFLSTTTEPIWKEWSSLVIGVKFVFISEPFYLRNWIMIFFDRRTWTWACLLQKCFSVALAMLLLGFFIMVINFNFVWSDLNIGFLLCDFAFHRLNLYYLKNILNAYWFSFKLFFKYPQLWAKSKHYTIHYLIRI